MKSRCPVSWWVMVPSQSENRQSSGVSEVKARVASIVIPEKQMIFLLVPMLEVGTRCNAGLVIFMDLTSTAGGVMAEGAMVKNRAFFYTMCRVRGNGGL